LLLRVQLFDHPRRSNSNILEQHFRKFQIGHISVSGSS
jgi:hypothetical protein